VANLALARKLAELFWRLRVHGITYVERGLKKYEEKVAQTEQLLLQKLARKYNLVLQPKPAWHSLVHGKASSSPLILLVT
jgi:hypothetical protein